MVMTRDHAPAPRRARGPERRRERRFVVAERRSGFDRRAGVDRSPLSAAFEARLLVLREQPFRFFELLVLVNLLSVLDLLITLTVLRMGAVELNPIMARLLEAGPGPAAAAKMGVVALASYGLWTLRRQRKALATAVLLSVVYGALVAYELVGIVGLL